MKRIVALLLVMFMLSPQPCIQAAASNQIIASQNFESDTGGVSGNLSISRVWQGANGTNCSLSVKQTKDLEDLTNLPGKMVKGNVYRISAWVKLNGNTLTTDTINFIYWTKTVGGQNGYVMIPAQAENINDGEWHYVEAIHEHNGLLNVIGADSDYEDEEASSRFDLRIGNGYISQSSGTEIKYYLDEFNLELIPGEDEVYSEEKEFIDINIEQDIWTDDVAAINGSVSFENAEKDLDLMSVLALYDSNNKLIGLERDFRSIKTNDSENWGIDLQNDSLANHAKLFLMESKTLKPIKPNETIFKLPAGSYIYVDSSRRSSTEDGTFENPYKTVEGAKNKVREMLPNAQNDIYVLFREGVYDIKSPIQFSNEDCSDTVNVIYSAFNNEKVVFSGGIKVKGFEIYNQDENIYRIYLGTGLKSRQFFVNGVRAVRARSESGLSDAEFLGEDGLSTSDTSFLNYKNISDLEMVFYSLWTNPRCQVSSVSQKDGKIIFKMDEPGWSAVIDKGASSVTLPYYYENALELLDEEGEWYLDSDGGYLYYKPRFFENINKPEAILPIAEKLIEIKGASANQPVKNILFKNIEFSYTTWNRPSSAYGHSDAQNNHLRYSDIDDELIDGAIEVENAHNVDFNRCTFSRLGSTGLKMTGAIQNCDITENEFFEISGSAITLGDPDTSDVNIYNPTSEELFITDNNIVNNYIHKVAVDYKSAAALSVGFPKKTVIRNNEITDTPYSGMHIGYGWDGIKTSGLTDVEISSNYIHNVLNDKLSDGGGIYTNGPTGGNADNYNKITENYVEDVRCSGAALYTDEGSSFWELSKNVVDLTSTPWWYVLGESNARVPQWLSVWTKSIDNNRYIDNYTTTSRASYNGGPNNVLEGTVVLPFADWPEEAKNIIEKSGIEPESEKRFVYRLQKIETESSVKLNVSDSTELTLKGFTGKNKSYELSNVSIYVKSSDEDVVSVNDLNITAVSPGECIVTIAVVENGICWMKDVSILVS